MVLSIPTGITWSNVCKTFMTPSLWLLPNFAIFRTPTAGPSNGWFREVWERDLPDIANNLGCNTLRLYNVNPSNRLATEKYVGGYNIYQPIGKDHRPFLDYCQSLGLKVRYYSIPKHLRMRKRTCTQAHTRTHLQAHGNKRIWMQTQKATRLYTRTHMPK